MTKKQQIILGAVLLALVVGFGVCSGIGYSLYVYAF